MKIALVSPYDFAHPGGVTNHISSLERHLTRLGYEVKVIAPASKASKAVSIFGDRFIPIGRPRPIPTSGSIARITISVRLASTIKRVLRQEKFDIIHLHEPFMPMLCSAVLRFSDTINIGTFHAYQGSPGYRLGRPITTILLNRRARKLNYKIAVSQPAMEYASHYVPGHYDIIPNGIDLERFTADISPIEEFRDDKLNILFVGRLEKRKGVDYLLKAYKQVKQEIPNVRLIIVGPGSRLKRKYEKQVKKDRLKDVIFKGFVSHDDLPRYYKTADVFCAPATSRESFGIVLLEAMAVGAPVVATSVAGYASVITHGEEGYLVPPRDYRELARSLISLLKDESLRRKMGAKGIIKTKKYDWEEVTQKILDCYTRILDNSPDVASVESEVTLV